MSLRPNNTNGYVYYLRLKTHKGIFYKIGYTSKDSINERFSYGNSENHKLVDKVLMFKYCVHAYDIEQRLHLLFRKYRAFDKNAFMSSWNLMNISELFCCVNTFPHPSSFFHF